MSFFVVQEYFPYDFTSSSFAGYYFEAFFHAADCLTCPAMVSAMW